MGGLSPLHLLGRFLVGLLGGGGSSAPPRGVSGTPPHGVSSQPTPVVSDSNAGQDTREPPSPQGLGAQASSLLPDEFPLDAPAALRPPLEGSNIRNRPQTPAPTLQDQWTLHSLITMLPALLLRYQKAAIVVLTRSATKDIRVKRMQLNTLTTSTRNLFLCRTDLLDAPSATAVKFSPAEASRTICAGSILTIQLQHPKTTRRTKNGTTLSNLLHPSVETIHPMKYLLTIFINSIVKNLLIQTSSGNHIF